MTDVLTKICDDKHIHINKQKAVFSQANQEEFASKADKTRGFAKRLSEISKSSKYGVIAEIKKASPSRGLIRKNFDAAKIAFEYQSGGAACVSVLTDEPYFKGKDSDLVNAKKAVTLPVLRKDFIIDSYQIPESRALGADCILLIVAALDSLLAKELAIQAHEWDMDVLIEVHNIEELEKALLIESDLIGINDRNLKSLEVDISTTENLAPLVPKERITVSESGLFTADDLKRMSNKGVNCFLIGEALMRQKNISSSLKQLLES